MPRHDIIVVGASAGGVEALTALARAQPADLKAAIFVVLHVAPHHRSILPHILTTAGKLKATHAKDNDPVEEGQIYVAPPDRHLLVQAGRLRLSRGPQENGSRPAIDALFRSAARSYGARVVGVVLTGALDDGTAGLVSVKQRGGLAVVQDPATAFCPDMPRSALEHASVDYCLPIERIGPLLPELAKKGKSMREKPMSKLLEKETRIAADQAAEGEGAPGAPSEFGCPSCGGVLNEVHDGDLLRFRCRVGHAFGAESLRVEQQESLEGALWAALRALEEQAALCRRMAVRGRELGQNRSATRYDARAHSAEHQARTVRGVLQRGVALSEGDAGVELAELSKSSA